MTDFVMDTSELNTLSAQLEAHASAITPEVTAVVHKGAVNVKRDARQFASGLRHAPHYPYSIDFDMLEDPGSIGAEIGPDKDHPQGALGNILEYGTAKNPPFAHLGPALDREGPKFMAALEQLATDLP